LVQVQLRTPRSPLLPYTTLFRSRSADCDLAIRDILLSRKHCALERIGDAWIITDLSSKNGTRVNSEAITRHILHDSDVIRIGRRSEEHTSELQSQSNLVCRLLLE